MATPSLRQLWKMYKELLASDIDMDGRGGPTFSDTGISGFLSGHDRREVHAKAETQSFCGVQGASGA